VRRSEGFLKGDDETSKSGGKWKWGVKCSEVQRNEVIILGEMCVLSLIYSYVADVCSVQYVVSLLFASVCYFLITRLTFLNILFFFGWFFCFCFLYSVFLYCFVYCFSLCI